MEYKHSLLEMNINSTLVSQVVAKIEGRELDWLFYFFRYIWQIPVSCFRCIESKSGLSQEDHAKSWSCHRKPYISSVQFSFDTEWLIKSRNYFSKIILSFFASVIHLFNASKVLWVAHLASIDNSNQMVTPQQIIAIMKRKLWEVLRDKNLQLSDVKIKYNFTQEIFLVTSEDVMASI